MAVDDSYTKALFHFNGDNDSTTITDEAGNTVNPVSGIALSTTIKKFGTASILFSEPKYFSVTNNNLKLGTTFTVDFWIYPMSFQNRTILFDTRVLNGAFARMDSFVLLQNATTGKLCIFTQGDYSTDSSSGLTLNDWNHVAVVATGGTMKFYINGTQVHSFSFSTDVQSGALVVGWSADWSSSNWTGFMDELRVSVGIARWTENFDVPTAEYAPASSSITAYLGSTAISKMYLGETEISSISLG